MTLFWMRLETQNSSVSMASRAKGLLLARTLVSFASGGKSMIARASIPVDLFKSRLKALASGSPTTRAAISANGTEIIAQLLTGRMTDRRSVITKTRMVDCFPGHRIQTASLAHRLPGRRFQAGPLRFVLSLLGISLMWRARAFLATRSHSSISRELVTAP